MAREGSVAPKERVNIVYKSDLGGAQEEVELPFRFLVVGDFTGQETPDVNIEQRTLVSVDKTNFDGVLAGQKVNAKFNVKNVLKDDAAESEEFPVQLNFQSMKDFTPDAVTQQVPELKDLVNLRDALTMLKGPLGNVPEFRKKLEKLLDNPAERANLLKDLGLGEDK